VVSVAPAARGERPHAAVGTANHPVGPREPPCQAAGEGEVTAVGFPIVVCGFARFVLTVVRTTRYRVNDSAPDGLRFYSGTN
jgi:hypothetical protein